MISVTEECTRVNRRIASAERIQIQLGCETDVAERLADTATAIIEKYTGRVYGVQSYSERLAPSGYSLYLTHRPIAEVESVTVDGSDEAKDADDYTIYASSGKIYAPDGWTSKHHANTIISTTYHGAPLPDHVVIYSAGYTPQRMPMDLQQAALTICHRIATETESPGATGFGIGDYNQYQSQYAETAGAIAGLERTLDRYKVVL